MASNYKVLSEIHERMHAAALVKGPKGKYDQMKGNPAFPAQPSQPSHSSKSLPRLAGLGGNNLTRRK